MSFQGIRTHVRETNAFGLRGQCRAACESCLTSTFSSSFLIIVVKISGQLRGNGRVRVKQSFALHTDVDSCSVDKVVIATEQKVQFQIETDDFCGKPRQINSAVSSWMT